MLNAFQESVKEVSTPVAATVAQLSSSGPDLLESRHMKPVDASVNGGSQQQAFDRQESQSSYRSQDTPPSRRSPVERELIRVPREQILTSVEKSRASFIRRATCSSSPRAKEIVKEPVEKFVLEADDSATNDVTAPEVAATVEQAVEENVVIGEEQECDESAPEISEADGSEASQITVDKITENQDSVQKSVEEAAVASTERVDAVEPSQSHQVSSEPTSKPAQAKSAHVSHGRDVTNERDSSVATFLGESVFSASFSGENRLRKQVDVLMKARAKLEGQLEVMTSESKTALQQRAELQVRSDTMYSPSTLACNSPPHFQTQVAALTQQLKQQQVVATSASDEREALTSDMRTMKEMRSNLEQVRRNKARAV